MALLDNLLVEIAPEQQTRTDRKMRIAYIIDNPIKTKGLGKENAVKIVRKPSQITKWLSGTHNFTIETISDIERVLGIRILNLSNKYKSKPNTSGNVLTSL